MTDKKTFPVYFNKAFDVKLFDLSYMGDFFFFSMLSFCFSLHVGFLYSLLLHYYIHPY